MQKIENFNQLHFVNWNDIKVATGRRKSVKLSSFYGKTFFYHDKNSDTLHYRNLNIIQRICRKFFGCYKEFRRNNLWDYLKSKEIIKESVECPNKKNFRNIVIQKLTAYESRNKELVKGLCLFSPTSEDELIKIIDTGINLNYRGGFDDDPPLITACMGGKSKVAIHLIDQGADINYDRGETGYVAHTPFHETLFRKMVDVALHMIEKGLNVNARAYQEKTPLHLAVEAHDKEKFDTIPIIAALIEKKPDLNAVDKDGETPLAYACKKGSLEQVKLLVKAGAEINTFSKYGKKSPLNHAVKSGNIEVVRYLLDKGATIKNLDENPLWGAISYTWEKDTDKDLIELLIDRGAEINQENCDSSGHCEYPIHRAASSLQLEIIQLFIDRSVKVNSLDRFNHTPIYAVLSRIEYGRENQERRERIYQAAKLLLDAGADFSITPKYSSSILILLARHGEADLMNLLFMHTVADPNPLPNCFAYESDGVGGYRPLHEAVKEGHVETVRVLLAKGADPKQATARGGLTAIDLANQYASRGDRHQQIKELLERY